MPSRRVSLAGLAWLGVTAALATVAGCGCGPPAPLALGTYTENPAWPERHQRPAVEGRGLVARQGEIVVVEGDAEIVSGSTSSLGLVIDATRNDPAAVMARVARDAGDVPGILLLFTTFDDHGAGGPAYFLPVFNDVAGTGMGPIDQRATFGATRFEGLANLKRLAGHAPEDRVRLAAHELAHRHLAHLIVSPPASATVAPDLLGRQRAHWNAALDSDGSLLEGYDWRESGSGRFVIIGRSQRFSGLDLYGLGLVPAAEVGPFFFIHGARTEAGDAIPAEAQLALGTIALGVRIDLGIEDVVRALGPRDPPAPAAPAELRVMMALLTAPGQRADDPEVEAARREIEAFRGDIAQAWSSLTLGRGRLCTLLDGCAVAPADAGTQDAEPNDRGVKELPGEGCSCRTPTERGARSTPRTIAVGVLIAALMRLASGRRRRHPGLSSDRGVGARPLPAAPRRSGGVRGCWW
ncbi:MAG: hypothetical protein IT384_19495 [Deltaproteobacteria bacterium]|nr:hypothetical protein [Deltaproteobacteria bacterium]